MDGHRVLKAATAHRIVVDVLVAYGSTSENAAVVADHLVTSDLAGVRSHGFIRLPQYVDEILKGETDPVARPLRMPGGTGRTELDAARSFGQVAGVEAAELAEAAAKATGLGLVTVHEAGHTGRIGAYAEQLAERGCLAVVVCSGARMGHRVAPFGGREARLATNPIAFGIPSSSDPIVGDFSTAVAPEGVIRVMRNLGVPAPEGTLLSPDGVPTTDPAVLYEDPPGTILPLGGMQLGHRGFGLGLLVEAFATLLARDETDDRDRKGSNLAVLAVSVDADFASRTDRLIEYVRGAKPIEPAVPVMVPGEREYRRRRESQSLPVDQRTWDAVTVFAQDRGVPLDDVDESGPAGDHSSAR
jgi:hydroxycarboxylate dehydrogenase B